MPAETITSLADMREQYMPEDIASDENEIPKEEVRIEMYRRAAGLTEYLIDLAESNSEKDLISAVAKVSSERQLSKKQTEIFSKVAETIQGEVEKTTIVRQALAENLPYFKNKFSDELQSKSSTPKTDEQILSIMMFHSLTGEFPTDFVTVGKSESFIRMRTGARTDLESLHGSSSPNGFYKYRGRFNIQTEEGTKILEAPLIASFITGVSVNDYTTGVHERNHHVYEMLSIALTDLKLKPPQNLDKLVEEWQHWIGADDGGVPGAARYNLAQEGGRFGKIRSHYLERAKDEVLTRIRTGNNFEAFGENSEWVDYYMQEWDFNTFKENVPFARLGEEKLLEKTLKEDIRANTSYISMLKTGMKLTKSEEDWTTLLSVLESTEFENWMTEIAKTYKGNEKHFERIGNIFKAVSKSMSEGKSEFYTSFEEIQYAITSGRDASGKAIGETMQTIEPKIKALEAKLGLR